MTGVESDRDSPPEGFHAQWASTVGEEDGFALELVRAEDHEVVLEVYRDDMQQGALFLRGAAPVQVPLEAARWLLDAAARGMPPFVADEDRDYGDAPSEV